jgi:hypothetical protein
MAKTDVDVGKALEALTQDPLEARLMEVPAS